MAEFLTTYDTTSHIEKIIIQAQQELVLVSPYLDISQKFIERLQDAHNRRNVRITIIYGKNQLKPEIKDKLKALNNLYLYFYKDLHAKCYYNETSMIITSMNLYEYSEKNNREMGVLIDRQLDSNVYNDAKSESEFIKSHSTVERIEGTQYNERVRSQKSNDIKTPQEKKRKKSSFFDDIIGGIEAALIGEGYCIRCKARIPINIKQPLCKDCYSKWSKYKDNSYKEKYCHQCGKQARTTILKPLCKDCFSD